MEFILLLIVIILISLWYRSFIKVYEHWKEKNVKSLPSVPFVGTYMNFLKMKVHQSIIWKDIYDRYSEEKYIGGYKFATPELVVFDPEIIRTILVKDFNNFIDRGLSAKDDDAILNQHLFHLNGEKWRALRQKMTPTFTSSKMRKMFPIIVECGEELEANIKDIILNKNELEIKELIAKFTTDTIGSCAFGLQTNSMKDPESPFRKMGRKIFETSKFGFYVKILMRLLPNKLRTKRLGNQQEIETFFVNLVKELIKIRSTSDSRHDFIQLMLELRAGGSIDLNNNDDRKNNKLEITDELITAQCFVFFIAGFETSSTTMSYALRELALYPEIQEKVLQEIDAVLHKHDGKLTYDNIQEMEYLDMVIDETLRMYPPVPVLNRICNSTHKLPESNLTLDKGDKIVIPVHAIQRDPKYYPEPEKFKPERFTKEEKIKRNPFVYLPFGEGPRICIGSRFGKLQSAVGLISFLKKYTVMPCSATPIDAKLDPKSFLLTLEGGIDLKIVPRNKS